jgi:hypothetical protein
MAAIYMWRESGSIVIVTTPYPIEVTEKLAPGGDVVEGSLATIPESYGQSDKNRTNLTDSRIRTLTRLRMYKPDGSWRTDPTSPTDSPTRTSLRLHTY